MFTRTASATVARYSERCQLIKRKTPHLMTLRGTCTIKGGGACRIAWHTGYVHLLTLM